MRFKGAVNVEQFYREFGRRVSARRAVLKITQSEVGERIGASRASVANIEGGRQRIHVHHVYALARALKFDDLTELLPNEVPADASDDLVEARHEVSSVQQAQIESIVRNALASAKPKVRGK